MKASRRKLDLKKDVVASEAEVAGSTYLVTREWVSQEQQRCERFGISLEVTVAELTLVAWRTANSGSPGKGFRLYKTVLGNSFYYLFRQSRC